MNQIMFNGRYMRHEINRIQIKDRNIGTEIVI